MSFEKQTAANDLCRAKCPVRLKCESIRSGWIGEAKSYQSEVYDKTEAADKIAQDQEATELYMQARDAAKSARLAYEMADRTGEHQTEIESLMTGECPGPMRGSSNDGLKGVVDFMMGATMCRNPNFADIQASRHYDWYFTEGTWRPPAPQ